MLVAPRRPVYTPATNDRAVPGRSPGFAGSARSDPPPWKEPALEPASPPASRPDRRTVPGAAGLLAALLLLFAPPRPADGQALVPRTEDAELPGGGSARFRLQPFFLSWHREFGPGPEGGREVPLRADFDGPLLDRIFPGRDPLVAGLNDDAAALGFDPVAPGDASLGVLDVREMAVDVRGFLGKLEVGILDRLAVDAAVPVLRTEVEPFSTFDPTGADLGPAATVLEEPFVLLDQMEAARQDLQQRVDDGGLGPEEEARARALLEASGAFASTLGARVAANALLPLAGSPAGDQMLAFLDGLRTGFSDFGYALPAATLASELTAGTLTGYLDFPLEQSVRGWLAGEAEVGLRVLALDGFARTPAGRGGLEVRTALGVRLRLPLGSANSAGFIRPADLLGVPLGDGQQDLELSLYQDVRIAGSLLLNAVVRYGVQRGDRLLVRPRSPERPFSPAVVRTVERDPGDYLRGRLAPRLTLNPFLSVGAEYRYWHKATDSYRVVDGNGGVAAALEAETGQTRHRVGVGAFYRPDPPEEGESRASVPELGFVWQTAVAGSGGETPAAGLATMHVQVPVRLF